MSPNLIFPNLTLDSGWLFSTSSGLPESREQGPPITWNKSSNSFHHKAWIIIKLTTYSWLGGVCVKRIVRIQPQHIDRVIVPQAHHQHHSVFHLRSGPEWLSILNPNIYSNVPIMYLLSQTRNPTQLVMMVKISKQVLNVGTKAWGDGIVIFDSVKGNLKVLREVLISIEDLRCRNNKHDSDGVWGRNYCQQIWPRLQ